MSIYHIYTTKSCITHMLSCMYGAAFVVDVSCSVSHIGKVGGVNRNAAWCSFVRVHNVAYCLRHNQNYARDNQEQGDIFPVSPCKCVCIALEI